MELSLSKLYTALVWYDDGESKEERNDLLRLIANIINEYVGFEKKITITADCNKYYLDNVSISSNGSLFTFLSPKSRKSSKFRDLDDDNNGKQMPCIHYLSSDGISHLSQCEEFNKISDNCLDLIHHTKLIRMCIIDDDFEPQLQDESKENSNSKKLAPNNSNHEENKDEKKESNEAVVTTTTATTNNSINNSKNKKRNRNSNTSSLGSISATSDSNKERESEREKENDDRHSWALIFTTVKNVNYIVYQNITSVWGAGRDLLPIYHLWFQKSGNTFNVINGTNSNSKYELYMIRFYENYAHNKNHFLHKQKTFVNLNDVRQQYGATTDDMDSDGHSAAKKARKGALKRMQTLSSNDIYHRVNKRKHKQQPVCQLFSLMIDRKLQNIVCTKIFSFVTNLALINDNCFYFHSNPLKYEKNCLLFVQNYDNNIYIRLIRKYHETDIKYLKTIDNIVNQHTYDKKNKMVTENIYVLKSIQKLFDTKYQVNINRLFHDCQCYWLVCNKTRNIGINSNSNNNNNNNRPRRNSKHYRRNSGIFKNGARRSRKNSIVKIKKSSRRNSRRNSINKKQQRSQKNSNGSGKGRTSRRNSSTNTTATITITGTTTGTGRKGSGSKSREGSAGVPFENIDENSISNSGINGNNVEIENKIENEEKEKEKDNDNGNVETFVILLYKQKIEMEFWNICEKLHSHKQMTDSQFNLIKQKFAKKNKSSRHSRRQSLNKGSNRKSVRFDCNDVRQTKFFNQNGSNNNNNNTNNINNNNSNNNKSPSIRGIDSSLSNTETSILKSPATPPKSPPMIGLGPKSPKSDDDNDDDEIDDKFDNSHIFMWNDASGSQGNSSSDNENENENENRGGIGIDSDNESELSESEYDQIGINCYYEITIDFEECRIISLVIGLIDVQNKNKSLSFASFDHKRNAIVMKSLHGNKQGHYECCYFKLDGITYLKQKVF